ncbi:CGNR zinc finger domain-containing protein [Actinokineospora soli]|uniref:CGNR zinc finger domain-containing protein n=1 Tax=Actinokineospora soli TaxID=1048753 RepID=A0ABW2TS95_9PSEU
MDLVGNAVCLDFVNTVDKRPSPDRDDLTTAGGLVAWAEAAGLGPRLTAGADERLADAVALREAVHRVFAAVADEHEPPQDDLDAVFAWYARAVLAATPRREGTHYTLTWPRPSTADEILGAVAASAVRLLVEGPLDRVGACPSCGWLFFDTSRNGTRRWCSMATCGSRSKARRYFAGHRNH